MRNILQVAYIGAAIGAVALMGAPKPANAAVDFSAAAGTLAAKVTFDVLVGGYLQVVLTNTSTDDVLQPIQVLTGVFFNTAQGTALGSDSAVLTAGSSVIYDSQPVGGVVGGEWGYKGPTQLSGAPNGANSGISSSGLGGLFGQATFPGDDLSPPTALDGLQYGIVSAGDDSATGNGGVTGSGGLIKNSVTFLLSGYTGSAVNLATDITKVSFQYGTDLSEPNLTVGGPPPVCANGATNFPICSLQVTDVPEPMSMALLGVGLVGLGVARRRRAA